MGKHKCVLGILLLMFLISLTSCTEKEEKSTLGDSYANIKIVKEIGGIELNVTRIEKIDEYELGQGKMCIRVGIEIENKGKEAIVMHPNTDIEALTIETMIPKLISLEDTIEIPSGHIYATNIDFLVDEEITGIVLVVQNIQGEMLSAEIQIENTKIVK